MRLGQLLRLRVCFSQAVPKVQASQNRQRPKIEDLFDEVTSLSEAEMREKALKFNKERQNQQKARDEQAQKVRNYHQWEYFRGEDFIEKIPYSPHHTYTLQEQLNEQEDREREAIEQLQPMGRHNEKANLIRDKIAAYHDKQRKYEIEEFEKYLSEYPGSPKGPLPADDPEAYRNYAMKKIPKILQDEIRQEQAVQKMKDSGNIEDEDQIDQNYISMPAPQSILDYLGQDRQLVEPTDQPESQDLENKDVFALSREADVPYMADMKTDVPLIPNMRYQGYQNMVNHLTSWHHFRNFYVEKNRKKLMKQFEEKCEKLADSFEDDGDEWFELPKNVPSLCRYYRCLPKQLQDHPGIKDVYLGLEYSAPDFDYKKKEAALNWACLWALTLDDISDKVMTDYIASSREYVTPYMRDKLHTVHPMYTWDMESFLEELKRQEIKGEATAENKDAKPQMPPEVHLMWEEGAPNLPVDYYDNDDGFWDKIISEKLARYDAAEPMLKTRKHFRH